MVCGVNTFTERRGEFERLRVRQKRETEKTEVVHFNVKITIVETINLQYCLLLRNFQLIINSDHGKNGFGRKSSNTAFRRSLFAMQRSVSLQQMLKGHFTSHCEHCAGEYVNKWIDSHQWRLQGVDSISPVCWTKRGNSIRCKQRHLGLIWLANCVLSLKLSSLFVFASWDETDISVP